jgi:hypothetical protein
VICDGLETVAESSGRPLSSSHFTRFRGRKFNLSFLRNVGALLMHLGERRPLDSGVFDIPFHLNSVNISPEWPLKGTQGACYLQSRLIL